MRVESQTLCRTRSSVRNYHIISLTGDLQAEGSKAAGICGIPAELLNAGAEPMVVSLHALLGPDSLAYDCN